MLLVEKVLVLLDAHRTPEHHLLAVNLTQRRTEELHRGASELAGRERERERERERAAYREPVVGVVKNYLHIRRHHRQPSALHT
jgi:hypothetical protein